MVLAAEPDSARQPTGRLVLIVAILNFAHEKRRVIHRKIGAGAVDDCLIAGIAMYSRDSVDQFALASNFHRDAGVASRSAGPPLGTLAPMIVGRSLLMNNPAGVADEEFRVRRELSEADAEAVIEKLLFEPQLRQACGGDRLDVADGDQAGEVLVARAERAVDLKGIGERSSDSCEPISFSRFALTAISSLPP